MKTFSQSQQGRSWPRRISSTAVGFPFPAQRAKENSPALQCWVRVGEEPSPVGDERKVAPTPLSSLTGLSGSTTANPALRCWAIFGRPCGTVPTESSRCAKRKFASRSYLRLLACVIVLGVMGCRPDEIITRVDNGKIEMSLHFDKPAVLLGEPMWFTLRLHNHANEDLEMLSDPPRNTGDGPLQLGAVGSDGAAVRNATPSGTFEGMSALRKLPARGICEFSYFMPDWLTFERPGHYTITATRKLLLFKPGTYSQSSSTRWLPHIVDKQTTGRLEVSPADENALLAIIDSLKQQQRDGNGKESERAMLTLALMDEVNRNKQSTPGQQPLPNQHLQLLTKPKAP